MISIFYDITIDEISISDLNDIVRDKIKNTKLRDSNDFSELKEYLEKLGVRIEYTFLKNIQEDDCRAKQSLESDPIDIRIKIVDIKDQGSFEKLQQECQEVNVYESISDLKAKHYWMQEFSDLITNYDIDLKEINETTLSKIESVKLEDSKSVESVKSTLKYIGFEYEDLQSLAQSVKDEDREVISALSEKIIKAKLELVNLKDSKIFKRYQQEFNDIKEFFISSYMESIQEKFDEVKISDGQINEQQDDETKKECNKEEELKVKAADSLGEAMNGFTINPQQTETSM